MLWISKLFSSNTRRPSKGNGSQSEKQRGTRVSGARERIPNWDFYKATLNSEHYSQDADAWGEPEALWVLARPTGDGQRPRCLINIYVFMYILLGEGVVYVIFILTYAGVRDMPPCYNRYLLRFIGSVRQSCGREDPGGRSPSLGISLGGGHRFRGNTLSSSTSTL